MYIHTMYVYAHTNTHTCIYQRGCKYTLLWERIRNIEVSVIVLQNSNGPLSCLVSLTNHCRAEGLLTLSPIDEVRVLA